MSKINHFQSYIPVENEVAARREERRVHYAGGGTQATQQRSCDFISEGYIAERIQITDIAEQGTGVGKANGMVMFVNHAIPGDVIDARVYRKKKNFAHADIHHMHIPSPIRALPFCKHFGICGGCKWQHIDYKAQLELKQKSICDTLERIGKIDASSCEPILPSVNSRHYRNKMEYTFSHRAWLPIPPDKSENTNTFPKALGFHMSGCFDKILHIDTCFLQADPANEIRNAIYNFALEHDYTFYDLRNHTGELRNLIIRTANTGDLMVAVIFAYVEESRIKLVMDFVKNKFPQISSLMYVVNQKKNDTIFDQNVHCYAGNNSILETMPRYDSNQIPLDSQNLKFTIGLKSFYQTNSLQAYELYKIVADFANIQKNELVYDLYTGAGTIANFIAHCAKNVIGIDCVEAAIQDAISNSKNNNINNTMFYASDMKEILNENFVAEHGKPDVIIIDPPRAGLHPDVASRLLTIGASRIVYVSCNVATQARDLTLLTQKYTVARIKPVDMFPHTQHVENVVLLHKLAD